MRSVILASFFTVVFAAWTKTLCGVEYKSYGGDKALNLQTKRLVVVKFVKTQQVEIIQLFAGDENFIQLICHQV